MDPAAPSWGLIGLGFYTALDHHIRPLPFIAIIPAVASVDLVVAVGDRSPSPPRRNLLAAVRCRRERPSRSPTRSAGSSC